MNNETEINHAIQRAKQYPYIDGLYELAFGVMCLLVGLYFYLQITLPPDTLLANFLDAGLVLFIIGGVWVSRKAVQWLKARLTHPRTGFVSYPEDSRMNRRVAAGSAVLIGGIVAVLIVNEPASLAWMPAITGLLMGVALFFIAYRLSILRFFLLAAAAFLVGVGLSLSGLGDLPGLAVYYALFGLLLLLSGGLRLRAYLLKK